MVQESMDLSVVQFAPSDAENRHSLSDLTRAQRASQPLTSRFAASVS